MQSISVAIVACNEAENIRRTLASVAWANEINLVDSGSTDKTVEIAKSFGARIFYESWKGYGPQVNSALDKCTCDWILNLDADEWLTPELAKRDSIAAQRPAALQRLHDSPAQPDLWPMDATWRPLSRSQAASLSPRRRALARGYRAARHAQDAGANRQTEKPYASPAILGAWSITSNICSATAPRPFRYFCARAGRAIRFSLS